MKDLGKIRDRYDYSFDARQMGLVIFGVAAIAALVFVLGVSVGIQWQRKKQPEVPPQAKAQTGNTSGQGRTGRPAGPEADNDVEGRFCPRYHRFSQAEDSYPDVPESSDFQK